MKSSHHHISKKHVVHYLRFTIKMAVFTVGLFVILFFLLNRFLVVQYVPTQKTNAGPNIPQYGDSSRTEQNYTQSIYALSLGKGSFESIYSRPLKNWSDYIMLHENALYFADGTHLYGYDLSTDKNVEIYTNTNESRVIHHVLGVHAGQVYFAMVSKEEQIPTNYFIYSYNLRTAKVTELHPVKGNAYSLPTDEWEYNGTLYSVVSGGDGCGGGETVTAENGKRLVGKFAEGCVEGQRYLGVTADGSRIVAAAMLPKVVNKEMPSYCYFDVLYYINLETGKVEPLYDTKKITQCITHWSYNPAKNQVVLLSNDKVYLIDLTELTEKRFVLPHPAGYRTKLMDHTVVLPYTDTKSFGLMDVGSGSVREIPLNDALSGNGYMTILGMYNNTVYISYNAINNQ